MMQPACQKTRVNSNRQHRKSHNSDCVLKDREWDGEENQRYPAPVRLQGFVGEDNHDNQERDAGVNATALFCNFNADSGNGQHKSISKDGNSKQKKQPIGEVRRLRL